MKQALVVICLLVALSTAQEADPILLSSKSTGYPPLARQARIQGEVNLEFTLNERGEVASVTVVSGHPMLAGAAMNDVKSWRFELPKGQFQSDRRYQTRFTYRLATEEENGAAKATVDSPHSFRNIEVTVTAPSLDDGYAEGCPKKGEAPAIPAQAQDDDFVELTRTGCYGTCPAYTVRIDANGKIEWKGFAYVAVKGTRTAVIESQKARGLLDQFRSSKFWSLCASYSKPITDSATTTTRVSMNGQTKTVSNYADSAPQWVEEMEFKIDDAAETHRWRHGDPNMEPLSRIGSEAYYGKPGLTPLMRAASWKQEEKMKQILAEGADVSARDSSGWTALMYAAAVASDHPVKILLEAGADPNAASSRGSTALMASAFTGLLDEQLLKAGAKINAQDADGVTTLMILSSRGEAQEIAEALKAGADPNLKDKRGRTALDYLRLANCGKSPLRDPVQEWMVIEYRKCNAINEEDFKAAERLLLSAKRGKSAN